MLSVVFYWLHIIGVVFWIGGVAYIVLVLSPSLGLISLRDRARFVPKILRRFLVVVWISIAIIVASGIYRLVFVMGMRSLEPLFFTVYGNILSIKLLLVSALIGIAASISLRVYPRTVAHVSMHADEGPEVYACPACRTVAGSISRHVTLGLLLALAIIFLAVMLRNP